MATNNTDTGEIDIVCGAIRILKNSTKGGPVNQFGTAFGVDGPDAGTAVDFQVTDDNTAGEPDEDAGKGVVCVDNLEIGATYNITEVTPPTGYGPGTATDPTAVAVAGSCQTATFGTANIAIFTNPPLSDIQVRFRDGGSGETLLDAAGISCTNATGTTTETTNTDGWNNIETVTGIRLTSPTITVTCTIVIDP